MADARYCIGVDTGGTYRPAGRNLPPRATFRVRHDFAGEGGLPRTRTERRQEWSHMKWRLAVGLALVLAACSNRNVPPPNAVQARYEPSAGVIRVLVSNIRPMSDAELIAPDGSQYRTTGVVLVSGPHVLYNPPPSIGLGIGGFGLAGCCSGIGSGLGVSLPLGRPTPAAVSDQYLMSASIPAPADYARNWANYRLQVRIGDSAMLLNAPWPG